MPMTASSANQTVLQSNGGQLHEGQQDGTGFTGHLKGPRESAGVHALLAPVGRKFAETLFCTDLFHSIAAVDMSRLVGAVRERLRSCASDRHGQWV